MLNTDEMDLSLLRAAREVLGQLRSGTTSVLNPMPEGRPFHIALGSSPFRMPVEQMTAEQAAQYEARREQREQQSRKREFYISYRGISEDYRVLPDDGQQHDAGLYGSIGGMWGGAQFRKLRESGQPIPEGEEMSQMVEKQRGALDAVYQTVMAARPAMVCTSGGESEMETFANHFAAAMLLNP